VFPLENPNKIHRQAARDKARSAASTAVGKMNFSELRCFPSISLCTNLSTLT
jgi:hypothetical protein